MKTICECCTDSTREAFRYDYTDHKGNYYEYLCNRCFEEMGGWVDLFEEVTPEQLNDIYDRLQRQLKKDNAEQAVVFGEGLRHYALRQIIYYYELVMAEPMDD